MVAHQERLSQQVFDLEGPIHALETAREPGRMTNGNHYLKIQAVGEPGRGEGGKWILEQYLIPAQAAKREIEEVTPHAQDIFTRLNGAQLFNELITQFHQILNRGQILRLVLFDDIGVPVFDIHAEHALTM